MKTHWNNITHAVALLGLFVVACAFLVWKASAIIYYGLLLLGGGFITRHWFETATQQHNVGGNHG